MVSYAPSQKSWLAAIPPTIYHINYFSCKTYQMSISKINFGSIHSVGRRKTADRTPSMLFDLQQPHFLKEQNFFTVMNFRPHYIIPLFLQILLQEQTARHALQRRRELWRQQALCDGWTILAGSSFRRRSEERLGFERVTRCRWHWHRGRNSVLR